MKPGSRILITGGAGSCGRYVTAWLLARGHAVRVIDRNVEPLRALEGGNLTLVQAGIEDRGILGSALEGRELLDYRPMDPTEAKASLTAAISACSRAMTGSAAKNL